MLPVIRSLGRSFNFFFILPDNLLLQDKNVRPLSLLFYFALVEKGRLNFLCR